MPSTDKNNKKSGGRKSPPQGRGSTSSRRVQLEAELLIVTKPVAGIVATPEGVASMTQPSLGDLASVLSAADAEITPIFDAEDTETAPGQMAAEAMADADAMGEAAAIPLGTFFRVDPKDNDLERVAESLLELDAVVGAYVKQPAELATLDVLEPERLEQINDMVPALIETPAATPDYTDRQIYLNAAPAGIDAKYAWTLPGGRGAGLKIIDCEWGWRFEHEDLVDNQLGVISGTDTTSKGFENHGTAVIGVIGGDLNGFGITGICSDAMSGASSFVTQSTSTAIVKAAQQLSAGDLMILEIHRAGSKATGNGQFGYIAIEWWPDDFAAIRYAVSRGIIVCEAAGNGYQNLDDPVYNTPATGFPATWKNPFNTANPSSGAVVVGAGAPPPGTHGKDHGPDRSRLAFSNFGRRVDAQGYGREVTTTAYGDLQGESDANNNLGARNRWYTDKFSGTSSATPVVTGAIACAQGVLKAQGSPLLTPYSARSLLRSTGSPQQDAPGRPATQRVGNRPDLKQMIGRVAKIWHHFKTVQTTYAVSSSAAAWIRISDLGWRRIHPDSPDGVSNMLNLAALAQTSNRRIHAYADGSFVYRLYLI